MNVIVILLLLPKLVGEVARNENAACVYIRENAMCVEENTQDDDDIPVYYIDGLRSFGKPDVSVSYTKF